MTKIKIADISITNFCNFACNYCIANTEQEPIILNTDGSVKIHDLRYDANWKKSIYTAHKNNVPFDNESYNKTIAGIAHPRGHFLDFTALLTFIHTHLNGWLISITGGEPLYYPKIDSFIHELTKTNRVVLLTNLSLIRNHQSLMNIPVDKLYYRVGWHPEQRSTDNLINCISFLREHNASYIVNYILHPKHIEDGTYQNYIDILRDNNIPYEITRFEGVYKNELYSCHAPMKDWEQDIIGNFSDYIGRIPAYAPGSSFMLIQADGEIYECADARIRIGNVYENKLRLKPTIRPMCFTTSNICPAIKSNYDMHNRFTRLLSLEPSLTS